MITGSRIFGFAPRFSARAAVSCAGLPAFEDSYRNYGERKLNRCLAGEFLEKDTDEIFAPPSLFFGAWSPPYPSPHELPAPTLLPLHNLISMHGSTIHIAAAAGHQAPWLL
jgi:hypothetical protein